MTTRLDRLRDEHGKLPSYAWPGGYPLIYYTKDGMILCPDCANKDDINEDQAPIGYDPHWEGPPINCDDCGTAIESAYGDPNEDDDE